MKNIIVIAKKEIFWYLNSPVGYILAAVFSGLTNFIFWRTFFLANTASLRSYFEFLPWTLMFLIAGITMRTLAEEKRSGTIEILKTLPLSAEEIILGKFLGSMGLISLIGFISLAGNILTIAYLGKPDLGIILSQFLGFLLLSGAMTSIGIYLSSLTKNQIAAMLLTITSLFVLFIIGTEMFTGGLGSGFIVQILQFLSLGGHYDNFLRGAVGVGDLTYYISITIATLFLSIKKID